MKGGVIGATNGSPHGTLAPGFPLLPRPAPHWTLCFCGKSLWILSPLALLPSLLLMQGLPREGKHCGEVTVKLGVQCAHLELLCRPQCPNYGIPGEHHPPCSGSTPTQCLRSAWEPRAGAQKVFAPSIPPALGGRRIPCALAAALLPLQHPKGPGPGLPACSLGSLCCCLLCCQPPLLPAPG